MSMLIVISGGLQDLNQEILSLEGKRRNLFKETGKNIVSMFYLYIIPTYFVG